MPMENGGTSASSRDYAFNWTGRFGLVSRSLPPRLRLTRVCTMRRTATLWWYSRNPCSRSRSTNVVTYWLSAAAESISALISIPYAAMKVITMTWNVIGFLWSNCASLNETLSPVTSHLTLPSASPSLSKWGCDNAAQRRNHEAGPCPVVLAGIVWSRRLHEPGVPDCPNQRVPTTRPFELRPDCRAYTDSDPALKRRGATESRIQH